MVNPWLSLPSSPPFIAPIDLEVLTPLQHKCDLKLDLLPQTWTGNVSTAEVFMLALNPGFRPSDYVQVHDNVDYANQWRLALSFETRTPFYFLDPAFKGSGGGLYWERRLQELIAVVGIDAVAQKVMCVEHFAYKSVQYRPLGMTLPSQEYSFQLVRDAIRERKQIVIMRSERVWLESVPELKECDYIRLSNPRNPYLSRAQMTDKQFERLCTALTG
jgi:hypothetical protein